MGKRYILALDQGTTSSRAIVFNKNGEAVGTGQRPHAQIYEHPGWVAHNAKEIFENIKLCANEAVASAGVSPAEIAAIGITNQRETVVAWDKLTGEPVCEAVVWQCGRTASACERIKLEGFDKTIHSKTGLIVDPYFSSTKLRWILDNAPGAKELLGEGRLFAGTVDSWLVWNMTGGRLHVTDYSNASRTMLFNIEKLKWDEELLGYFNIPEEILPCIVPSSGVIGESDASFIGESVPVAGMAGDQQAALFGQTCFEKGMAKCTYGTGGFLLVNTGDVPVKTDSGLLTTVAWNVGGRTTYALEGSVFDCGSAIDWLIGELRLARDVGEINDICRATPDTDGAYVAAAFSGLGAPHWDMYARGAICGMNLSTKREHIVRATVESIAYMTRDVLDCMSGSAGFSLTRLNVDGGVSRSDFLMQFQADILDAKVERPRMTETTALGAAYMAGLAVSYWRDFADIARNRAVDAVFSPSMGGGEREARLAGWHKAVERAKGWAR